MNEKIDRRIQRTRKLLQNAVLELAAEKNFETITIEEITERANLGRTTFYLHYNDKRALLISALNKLLGDMFDRIYSDENLRKWKEEGTDPRQLVFEYAADQAELFQKLFRGEMGGVVLHHFRQRLAEIFNQITENWQKILNLTPLLPNPITTHYTAGAFTGVLIWWLENEMPYPPEEIYEMYHQLMVRGAAQAVGFPPGPQESLI